MLLIKMGTTLYNCWQTDFWQKTPKVKLKECDSENISRLDQ